MPNFKNRFQKFIKRYFPVASVVLLILLAVFLLWFNNSRSMQAMPSMVGSVRFVGEYRIGEGEWHKIAEGQHIPSTKGDVTLRGNFHEFDPLGNYVGIYHNELKISFYTNHINLTFYEAGQPPQTTETEHPMLGSSFCGVMRWNQEFTPGNTDPIEIVIHNPHKFGNETAIDEMLSDLMVVKEGEMNVEKDALAQGNVQRNAGILLLILSLLFIGTALFSTLIHVKNSKIIWLLAMIILCAGLYFAFSAKGVSFWNESVVSNTAILGFSMMFYMLFLCILIADLLKTTKIISNIAVVLLGAANAVFFILPTVTDVRFYDTWAWWAIVQLAVSAVLAVCLARELCVSKAKERWLYIGAFLPLVAFAADVLGTKVAIWKGGVISQYVFIVLVAIATIMVLRFIPHSINVAAKAKELEMEKIVLDAELAESRISTMMSQIRPHFIYNTLGSIEQLCKLDPAKAGELVHNFAKYLRGNFGELDNPKPILMSQEMKHVHHYVSIENVRFPDMTFTFEMNSKDFYLPALTVQPIVENAIKHGLMKLSHGGTIRVVTYETERDYCVLVEDDGMGFDTNMLIDERKHMGLRNIRERLKVMVGGKLEVESTVGVGTKVLITIPKEA